MAVNEEEFVELLEGESAIDLNNLREVSMFGVPDSVRGEVWKYLLGVSKEDKSQEMKMVRKLKEEYDQLDKTIHSEDIRNISRELKRFRPNITELHTDTNRKRFVYLITAYVNSHTEFEYISNGTLSLLAPFVYLCEEEYAAFFCFDSLVKRMEEEKFSADDLPQNVSMLMMFFQSLLPDLFTYFEDEEVGPNDWATPWVQFLLAKELPFDCVLRLWDTYFSCEEGLRLHVYICLAILVQFHEDLTELEHSELKGFLQHLPPMDMDQLIAQAYNIKEDLTLKNLI
ncbi:Rab-GAP TBC domain-containing protein [Balamuthia mandrillaris]